MGIVELLLTAVGLSMDAFAVAICKGLGMKRLHWGQAALIALFFGGFQALMPTLGWLLGAQFARYVEAVDHWIAFVLLAAIGGKMLWDALHESAANEAEALPSVGKMELHTAAAQPEGAAALSIRELFMLAIATSIDAFAVGISLAFLGVSIAFAACFIGATTFVLSLAGVAAGHAFGARWEKPASIVGGVVLIAIGVRILVSHLLGG